MLRWMAGSWAGTAPGPPVAAGAGAAGLAGAAAPAPGAARSAFCFMGAGATAPPPEPDDVDEFDPARLQPASTRSTQAMPAPRRQREVEGVMRVRRQASRGRFRQTWRQSRHDWDTGGGCATDQVLPRLRAGRGRR